MKKLVFTALCCFSLCVGSIMAQSQEARQGRQLRGMRGMNNAPVQLADTAITNHLELTPEQILQVDQLNQKFATEMKAKMMEVAQAGKKASREEREASMTELVNIRKQANKELREVLGTENYIVYLETALERAAMMRNMRPAGNQMQRPNHGGFSSGRGAGRSGRGGGFGGGFDAPGDGFDN